MAKRFIDTEMFEDSWFMKLKPDLKLLYIYLITKCNHAGIIELNVELIEFQTGLKSILTLIEQLGNRCLRVREDLFFLPKFIKFQYPNFPKSKVKQQESAVNILVSFGLFSNGKLTVMQELGNSYDNVIDNDNVNDNGNIKKEVDFEEKYNSKKTLFMNSDTLLKTMSEETYLLQIVENITKLSREEIKKKIAEFLKIKALELNKSYGEITQYFLNWVKKNGKETIKKPKATSMDELNNLR